MSPWTSGLEINRSIQHRHGHFCLDEFQCLFSLPQVCLFLPKTSKGKLLGTAATGLLQARCPSCCTVYNVKTLHRTVYKYKTHVGGKSRGQCCAGDPDLPVKEEYTRQFDDDESEGLRERTEYIDIFLFFCPSLNHVLFPMFCLLVEGECQI